MSEKYIGDFIIFLVPHPLTFLSPPLYHGSV